MAKKIIELKSVSKSFYHKLALQNINISIDENKVYGFSGPNGSGKTLTFKTILGFVKPSSGQVFVNGSVIRTDSLFAKDIGFALPEYNLLPNKSGLTNLKLLSLLSQTKEDNEIELLTYVGLNPIDDRKIKDYSLGMRQRLLIASALIDDKPILMFDEPTNALDEDGQQFMINLITDLKAKGKTILVSSHDAMFLKSVSDKLFYFNDGKVIREEEQQ
ncbi:MULTISPECIES: ATP-binding cassette domain-containing protein [Lactobacillales]|uniref:ATP-binding cassette domain-containing protein n=2 Tax=Bacillati TaxID=1783272 RepID=A0A6B1XDK9_BIFLN|nr:MULTISPECIES: ATP-binding cassette domain-containing protein [Lactobacillales]MCE2140755.1 ATP-binding cassette domain-containing protein [Streptococcus thermophilus]MZU05541.1 ATP-binding cassette domain-containing protein [Bifidobacterium longum]AUH38845.1 ABC transporter ATP-binding protein [Lactiplantibacillus plantarum]MBQ0837775.1 ATP-binding cassette domain-containing protein [Lactiplantibacillus pentosus]MBT9654389.1 ATP-binding cassette domain-containing protein [Lactiplantibacillu